MCREHADDEEEDEEGLTGKATSKLAMRCILRGPNSSEYISTREAICRETVCICSQTLRPSAEIRDPRSEIGDRCLRVAGYKN